MIHDNEAEINYKHALFTCVSIIILLITFYGIKVSSLESTINSLNSELAEKNKIVYNLEQRAEMCMDTVESFRTKMNLLVESGDIGESLYEEVFPKSEAEILDEILSTKPLELDIETLLLAYKNSANDGLYKSYSDKHIKLTAFVKTVTENSDYFYVDNRNKSSFFGSKIEIGEKDKESLKEIINSLKVGDKVEICGVGDTEGLTFRLKNCTYIRVIEE